MKKAIVLVIILSLIFSGCGHKATDTSKDEDASSSVPSQASAVNSPTSALTNVDPSISIPEDELGDDTPYEYTPEFEDLNDEELLKLVEDELYLGLVNTLDSDQYFVQNVSSVFISKEYIEELEYNSKSNIFFGYTLAELDAEFQGTRYVFTLGDEGDTIVVPFENYDDSYKQVLKNVAIGSGVILVCVTVSVVSGGLGAPAVSMIFAASAKTGTIMALSSGALSAVAAGIVTGLQTGDMEEAKKAALLTGSESFKWGAISGAIAGGLAETAALHSATLNGLTMNEAAAIQKESGFPLEVIKQIHNTEEYEALRAANLKATVVNGKMALVRSDIDLNLVDEFGRTNIMRMQKGLSPLDANGVSYELHHVGQNSEGALAILTQAEHDNCALHGFKSISEIDRHAFAKQRSEFWKTMAKLLVEGGI